MQFNKLLAVVSVILLGAIVTSTVRAHTEDAPLIVDLIADGGSPATEIDVGDVLVWNDADFLYIKVETTDGWCATDTHLQVFLDAIHFTDIPITGSGNPKVGKFDITMAHACATVYDVPPIPLDGWSVGTQLYIAAHADVEKLIAPDIIRYESAWAFGDSFPGKSWAMFFGYEVQDYCCSVTGYAETSCGGGVPFYWYYTYNGSTCNSPGQLSATKVGCFSQTTYWSVIVDDPVVEVIDNMAELTGEVTQRFGIDSPFIGEVLSIKVWDNTPDIFQFKWNEGDYETPALYDIAVGISCGGAVCPCFDASNIQGVGIDYQSQVFTDAVCIDSLPDAIQLRGTRDGSGNPSHDWIANAVYPPVLPTNQCFFTDALYSVDNSTGNITDAEVAACMNILLNSQMFSLNACPVP